MFVEYAKQTPTDILIQISLCNRGPEASPVHVLPTLWFRNIWTWWPETQSLPCELISQERCLRHRGVRCRIGDYFLYCEGKPSLLFTENETNNQRVFGTPNAGSYVKDGINDFVVARRQEAVNPRCREPRPPRITNSTWGRARRQFASGSPRPRPTPLVIPSVVASRRCGGASAGRRRILPRHNASRRWWGRRQGHATGIGGNALEQAVLLLRPGQVARGARARSGPSGGRRHGTANGRI